MLMNFNLNDFLWLPNVSLVIKWIESDGQYVID